MSATLVLEASRALPLLSVSVAFKRGAVLDPADKAGASRLLLRLMRRTGGGSRPDELDARIDRLGAALSADVSHSTVSLQGTCIARSASAFFEILEEVLLRPGLSEEEFERLKRESKAELISALDHDSSLARRFFRRRMYAGHPYGNLVSGTPASLESVGQVDLATQRSLLIRREGALCAFAGDVNTQAARAFATRLLEALPERGPLPADPPEPTFPEGRHLLVVDKPERTQTQILIGTRGTHAHDDDHIALHVANTVFGGTFTSRLMQEVRAKRGWSYGASSSLPIDRRRLSLSLHTFPKLEDAAACVALKIELLEKWVEHGITEEELAWAKQYLVRSHAFAIDTAGKRVAQQAEEVLYELPEGYHARYIEHVQAVTLEQANRAVKHRINPNNLLVVVVGTNVSLGAKLRGAIPGLASDEVVAFDTPT